MTLGPAASLSDVGFAVCTALDRVGERAVLCGGSAATYYAPEAYQSRDLDFVLRFGARAKIVDEALRPLGFVRAPEGTAVRVQSAKTRVTLEGLDDVDVLSAKGRIVMRDVAGTVRVRSAAESIDLTLSSARETRSVDVQIARVAFSLVVPAARGGDYRFDTVRSRVSAPPPVEGGIPIRIQGARAEVAIRAA
jgi:hypothetical protein